MQVLEPFREQFLWSRPTDIADPAYAEWDYPIKQSFSNMFKMIEEDNLISDSFPPTSRRRGIDGFVVELISVVLLIIHFIARTLVLVVGALLELVERRAKFQVIKLLFYILKQPFKWGEIAISSAMHILGGFVGLGYAITNGVSYLWRGKKVLEASKHSFNIFIEKSPRAILRLFITGLIGLAGYFLGPLGVLALAGILGTVGAGLIVAGIGTISATAVQAVAIKTIEFCSSTGLMYRKGLGNSTERSNSDESPRDLREDKAPRLIQITPQLDENFLEDCKVNETVRALVESRLAYTIVFPDSLTSFNEEGDYFSELAELPVPIWCEVMSCYLKSDGSNIEDIIDDFLYACSQERRRWVERDQQDKTCDKAPAAYMQEAVYVLQCSHYFYKKFAFNAELETAFQNVQNCFQEVQQEYAKHDLALLKVKLYQLYGKIISKYSHPLMQAARGTKPSTPLEEKDSSRRTFTRGSTS